MGLSKPTVLEDSIQNIFSEYIDKKSLFKNKRALTSTFIPSKIYHREKEISLLGSILAPSLKNYQPSNVFIYGTVGTGKTICTKFVINQLKDVSKKTNTNLVTIYVNCKMKKVSDTEYRLFAQLLKEIGITVPDTGLPTDVLYRKFFEKIDEKKQTVVIIIDEIDALFKKIGDDFLYNLTRINTELKNSGVSVIGITNDLSFRERLDVRVKSSLSEEEILFAPYNALQLKNILEQRIEEGFDEGVIDDAVLNKVAAIAAQEHGDARRALDLLRVAGEIAERSGVERITEEHVDTAEEKIDADRVMETVKSQPKQSQAVLYAIFCLHEKKKDKVNWADNRLLTGDVFAMYKNIIEKNGLKSLTQRRISDLIGELDMLGIINAKIISKGRYGRTREISLSIQDNMKEKIGNLLSDRFGV